MASMTKNNLLIFNPVTLADVRKMHFPPYNTRPSEILIVAATVGVVVLLIHSTLLPDASCIVLPQPPEAGKLFLSCPDILKKTGNLLDHPIRKLSSN